MFYLGCLFNQIAFKKITAVTMMAIILVKTGAPRQQQKVPCGERKQEKASDARLQPAEQQSALAL